MIDRLIAALGTELDLTAEDIADIFWLTHLQQQQAGVPKESTKDSQEPASSSGAFVGDRIPPGQGEPGTSPLRNPISPPQPPAEIGLVPRRRGKNHSKAPGEEINRSIKVPNAPSIRDRLSLIKALRPLIRPTPSGTKVTLDETATATKIAEERIWLPVTQPVPEPWLELALVVDESTSMLIWRRTVLELQQLLRHYGAFRDVRTWGLVIDDKQVCIRPGIGVAAKRQSIRSPQELIDPAGRRLILVVTDCLSSIWQQGTVLPALKDWANNGPVAIFQMLPERMWGRTALRQASAVELYGLGPGVANKKLFVIRSSLWNENTFKEELEATKIPVLNLEPELASVWSQMVSGKGSTSSAGFLFSSEHSAAIVPADSQLPPDKLSPEQRVNQFWSASSSNARRLASLLAASPVISLPVIRLIQETMLPRSEQVHVAEVLLGGLFALKTLPNLETHPDDVEYRFTDEKEDHFTNGEIRSVLLNSAPVTDTVSVLSKYISERFGRSLDQFIAWWRAWSQSEDRRQAEKIRPFAVVTAEVLRRKGRQYIEFVQEVEEHYGLVEGPPGSQKPRTSQPKLSLFSEDTGETLRAKIVANYAPKQLLNTKKASDLAFEIDSTSTRIVCIYTGYSIQRSPNKNPRRDALEKGISRETIFPQSKAAEAAQSDVHNITPARVQVNSARSNLPFAEIPLNEVRTWFHGSEETTSAPTDNMEEYAKLANHAFEPRDAAKGRIARAMFYIYTIYGDRVDADYFEQQKETLRKWHRNYPATEAEIERSRKVANSPQGNPNPFVLDPTLVDRIYFTKGTPEPEWQDFEFEVATAIELQSKSFEVATIVLETNLQPFEFEVATVEVKPTGRKRKQPNLSIQRQRQQAWQFTEDLGDEVVLEMVSIPEGSFLMGSPEGEPEQLESEGPQHEVNINLFFIGKYPVTQAQWRAVAALPQVSRKLKPNPSRFQGDDRPVEQISWLDAVEFCDRLSEHTNRPYRLPSEAEWEYACRAGTTTPFHFGETITTDLANYDGNYAYGAGSEGTYRQETTPVGSFGVANAFGLYDMHGNVWEWCLDHWHSNYEEAPTDGSAWLTEDENSPRLLRGGSWFTDPRDCRSAFRNGNYPDFDDYFGLRVVCAASRTL